VFLHVLTIYDTVNNLNVRMKEVDLITRLNSGKLCDKIFLRVSCVYAGEIVVFGDSLEILNKQINQRFLRYGIKLQIQILLLFPVLFHKNYKKTHDKHTRSFAHYTPTEI